VSFELYKQQTLSFKLKTLNSKLLSLSNEELKQELLNLHPSLIFEEGGDWMNMFIDPLNGFRLQNNSGLKKIFSSTIFFVSPVWIGKPI
jgi:hypothetical protein